jgi:L-threonylcarbamoyladenylate synthase
MSQSSEQIQHSASRCNIALASDPATLQTAVQILASGGLVAIPTETVYGLGAAINNEISVAKIFAVKGRPQDHPLIVHIANIEQIHEVAINIHDDALKIAHACWPGALTLLLHRSDQVSLGITGGRETVAVRVPDNDFTRQLITNLESPIAAPSANRFGKVSPTTAQHVCDDLQTDVDLIVDDGASSVGVESTIVDFTVSPPQLLRPGGIPLEDIEMILGYSIGVTDGMSRASGMLQNHYQPACKVFLVNTDDEGQLLKDTLVSQYDRIRILDRCDNLPLYATLLYSDLRQADTDLIQVLITVLPENNGLGAAIRDRLTKAAGSGPPLPAS